jgi:hypothetical protein
MCCDFQSPLLLEERAPQKGERLPISFSVGVLAEKIEGRSLVAIQNSPEMIVVDVFIACSE